MINALVKGGGLDADVCASGRRQMSVETALPRKQKRLRSQSSEETNPATNLIPGLWPPELWHDIFLLLKQLSVWCFVIQP